MAAPLKGASNGSDYLLTPRGLRHRASVHQIEPGTRIKRTDRSWQKLSTRGELLREVPLQSAMPSAVKPVPTKGWICYADWTNDGQTAVSYFETKWTVPPPPRTKSGQTIFLFNSMLNGARDHILQPVLQWGTSAVPGSGDFWAVASWWVGREKDPVFISGLVRVEAGQSLTGRIRLSGRSDGLCNYACEFSEIAGTTIMAENLPQLTACTETLEAYGITTDTDYPGTDRAAFTAIVLRTGDRNVEPNWTANGNPPPRIVGSSEVDLFYPSGES